MANKKSRFIFWKNKKKRINFRKELLKFLKKFNKKRKSAKKKKRIAKFFSWFKKNKKQKIEERRLLKLILILLILVVVSLSQQIICFSNDLIQLEAQVDSQKVQFELKSIEIQIVEIESDFSVNLDLFQWSKIENRQLLAKKIRHLDYLNAHLAETIESYNQDFSLQFYRKKTNNLEKVFEEARNVQLISKRIVNKIDTLLLFDNIDENQRELLEKDFDLFYEKIKLISFI